MKQSDPVDRPDAVHQPSLAELGADLLVTSRRRRLIALCRPFAGVSLFAVVAWLRWWWLTPVIVFGVFVSVVTVTHDVVHRTIGLSARATDWALFATGLVLLESGHAYRATHTQHHRLFPHPDDPEGHPADLSLLGALLHGPVFLVRLWFWSYRRGRDRGWLLAEAAVPVTVLGGGVVLWPYTPGVLAYAVMMIVGSWVYPLLTVYLPHHDYGDTPLTQTRTLRGRIIPAMFLELTYHLEHHLYPQVPSHHLPELARRLETYLAANGVRAVRVV
ncbi:MULTISPECIES: fatty acid desaturase [Streptomyces]|uniref:fatty acid desaturase family protein n=1 Tax=Streptomyces TaxID=1883 RepID=UPI0018DF502F|nr:MULTISPECIES: fatty acid desaturase [Streptomyces]MCZ4099951.1 fatty acid desaturase [Streptomyces sp. H39-C1]